MLPSQRRINVLAITSLLALALAPAARGAVTYSEEKDDNGFVETTVLRLSVTPAAEPTPALKYRLQARDIDLEPGNAASFYYRALTHLDGKMESLRSRFRQEDELDKWYGTSIDATPIDELPVDKLRAAVDMSLAGIVSDQLALATSRRNCEWQIGIEELRGIDLIYLPLEEFQDSREFARLLALRIRLAIAERRYADAINDMRMLYRIAQDFASAPFLVSGLIGLAEAGVANGTMIDLIAAPGSPNMYWALTELPEPLISLRPAARFESEFGLRMFPFLHNAHSTDRSPQEWNRLYTQAVKDLAKVGSSDDVFVIAPNDMGAGIGATALALLGYSHAKQQLVAQGMDRDEVEQMSVGQVMAVYSERNYQRYADDFEKLWYVPFWEMRRLGEGTERRLYTGRLIGGGADREVLPIVSLLLPAMQAARSAQVRLEREFAVLRVIEALRTYAAANNGQLPDRLDAITQVPIPLNPATGKPFLYHFAGNTAILEIPESDGTPNYQRRFEIQIASDAAAGR